MGCGDGSIKDVGNNAFKVNSHTIRLVVGKLKSCYGYGIINENCYGGRSCQRSDGNK